MIQAVSSPEQSTASYHLSSKLPDLPPLPSSASFVSPQGFTAPPGQSESARLLFSPGTTQASVGFSAQPRQQERARLLLTPGTAPGSAPS